MDEPKRAPFVCKTPDCSKPVRARDYCMACYYRLRRAGQLGIDQPPPRWKHALSNIDPVARTGDCRECGPGIRLGAREGDKFRCLTAANAKTREWKQRARNLRRSVLKDACEICGSNERLMWDHDHSTEEFRGTLCSLCNTGLGMFRDRPELLREAIKYLARHNP